MPNGTQAEEQPNRQAGNIGSELGIICANSGQAGQVVYMRANSLF